MIFKRGGGGLDPLSPLWIGTCVCSNSLKPAKFHVAPPWDRGKDGKFQAYSFVAIHYCYPPPPRPPTFRRALKIIKLKAPLFPGMRGGGTNKGCISSFNLILNLKIWSMQNNFASFIVKVHSLNIKDIRILRLFKILNFSYGVIEYLMNINEADEQILG